MDCRLGLIAAGTGNDFAKSLRVPATDFVASARFAVDGPDRRVDVGRVEEEWFINSVGFGFDVAVLEELERVSWVRGPLLYAYAAVRQLLTYEGLEVECDGAAEVGRSARRMLLVIANGSRFGGAFRIAPKASLVDGLLDLIAIPDASALERLRLFIHATRGSHVSLSSVQVQQASRYTLGFDAPPTYDLDGELRRARSSVVEVECVPAALRVVGART